MRAGTSRSGRAESAWTRPATRLALDPAVALMATAAVLAAILSGALASALAAKGHAVAVAELTALGAYVAILLAVPVRILPVIALLTTLVVPTSSSLLPASTQDAAIGVVPLAVWLARERPGPRRQTLSYLIGIGFVGWLAIGELAAPLHTRRGVEWLLVAGVAISGPCIRQPLLRDPDLVRKWFLRVATAAACYAVVEGFLLHRNIAFAFLFDGTSWWGPQHASISYRVTTIFGHPLVNGLVFAVAGTFAAAGFLRRRERPVLAVLRLALLVAAVLATHSRGPAVGLGVGIILVLLLVPSHGYGKGARRAVLCAGAILAGAVIVSGLQARNASIQGEQSVALRSTVVAEAFDAVRRVEPFGAGPGQSEAYRVSRGLPGTGPGGAYRALENSYAELLVSVGVFGLALFCAALLVPIVDALRSRRRAEETAALVALLTVIAGFNAIEGFPSVLVLISLLLISVMQPHRTPPIPPPP